MEIQYYSKKNCHKILIKCTMTMLLDKACTLNIDNFKQRIKIILLENNYDNQYILKCLDKLNRSQIKSMIDLGEKTISKYKYTNKCEFILNDSDFDFKNKNISSFNEKIIDLLYTLRNNVISKN